MMEKIDNNILCWDAHVHLFPENLMQAIYRHFRSHYRWALPFPADPGSLLEMLQKKGAEKVFALAYIHKEGLARQVNRWLASFCASNPQVVPFGAVHPSDEDLSISLKEALDDFGFAGLKLHCLVQPFRPDDERLFPVYEALLQRSKGIIIHASSFPQPADDRLGAIYVSRLLRRFPNLRVTIPHLGLYDLAEYRELLAEYPGLYLDTSFVFQNGRIETPVDDFLCLLETFPARILYGSDFPFILEPPEHGISRILKLDLSPELQNRLFRENARSFLSGLLP